MGKVSTNGRSGDVGSRGDIGFAVASASVAGLAAVLLGLGVALLWGGQVTKSTYGILCWLSLGLSAGGLVLGALSRKVLVGKMAVAISVLIILWGAFTLLMTSRPAGG